MRCVGRTVEPLTGGLEEQHHHVLEGGIRLAGPVRPKLVPVAEGGLVTVMPVGDGDRLSARRIENQADALGLRPVLRHRPEAVANAIVVDDVGVGGAGGKGRKRLYGPSAPIGEETDYRAGVDAGGPEQLVTILLGRGEGPLVGQDARAGDEILEPKPAEETALSADLPAAGNLVRLLVDVDARAGLLAQRAVLAPAGQQASGAPISVVRLLTGLDLGQVQSNGVLGVARQQGLVQLGPDHVVRRTHDAIQIAYRLGVEPKRAKGSNLWHPVLLGGRFVTDDNHHPRPRRAID